MSIHERAERAKALLADPTFQEALADLTDGTITQWRATASGSAMLREQLAAEVRALDSIKAKLQGWIDAATFEDRKVERIERRRA
jgi:hypothetical protein